MICSVLYKLLGIKNGGNWVHIPGNSVLKIFGVIHIMPYGKVSVKLADCINISAILSSLRFVYPNISKEIWLNIFYYRISVLEAGNEFPPADIAAVKAGVNAFATDNLAFDDLRAEIIARFPGDSLNQFLQIL